MPTKKESVTRNLREVIEQVTGKAPDKTCWADPRMNKQAVGVKFYGLRVKESDIPAIVRRMEKRGFEFVRHTPVRKQLSRSYGRYTWATGDRFTFMKYNSYMDKTAEEPVVKESDTSATTVEATVNVKGMVIPVDAIYPPGSSDNDFITRKELFEILKAVSYL